ncbi:hypothetical protein GCM10020331_019650 [Ectobacillus funiculus]
MLYSITKDIQVIFTLFANNIHTYEGGTHEVGFKTALTRVVNDYARKKVMLLKIVTVI